MKIPCQSTALSLEVPVGSILGWGAKIPQATRHKKNKIRRDKPT